MPGSEPEPKKAMKQCPFCAEDIKAAAIKCKHCQSSLLGDAEPASSKPAQRFVHCLVCRTQNPEEAEACSTCGALKGQNFVMAPGQAPPQQASRGEQSGPPAWMWWAIGLTMVTITATLIGVLASTKIGLIVGVAVVVLVVMAVS